MKKAMRIAHLIETGNPGGAEIFVARICQQQLESGLDARVYLIKDGWLANLLRSQGVPVAILPEPRWSRPATLVPLLRQMRRDRISVLHSHEFLMNCVCALSARLLGIKHVATVHGGHYYSATAMRRWAYRLVARLSGLVAVSQVTARQICSEVPVSPSRVRVIANGFKTSSPQPGRSEALQWRHSRGIPAGVPVIGTVGALRPEKGHADLIRAFALVRHKYPEVHLAIAGRGRQWDALQQQIQKAGLDDCVHLLGHVEEVALFLANVDVFAMASHTEGMPLALLEAMGQGVPVIATRVGGVPEVIDSDAVGRLVPPYQPLALAAALLADLDNPENARTRGQAGRRRVEQAFDQSRVVDEYMDCYRSPMPLTTMGAAA